MATPTRPSQGIRWSRILAEGAAIVVSILLAFSIDAWWDVRQASADEAAVVETLLAEIQVAIDQLDHAIALHRGVMDAAEQWERASSSTPLDSLADLVHTLNSHRTPELTLSSVDALLASGRLSLIGDHEMRTWIAAWPGSRKTLTKSSRV